MNQEQKQQIIDNINMYIKALEGDKKRREDSVDLCRRDVQKLLGVQNIVEFFEKNLEGAPKNILKYVEVISNHVEVNSVEAAKDNLISAEDSLSDFMKNTYNKDMSYYQNLLKKLEAEKISEEEAEQAAE